MAVVSRARTAASREAWAMFIYLAFIGGRLIGGTTSVTSGRTRCTPCLVERTCAPRDNAAFSLSSTPPAYARREGPVQPWGTTVRAVLCRACARVRWRDNVAKESMWQYERCIILYRCVCVRGVMVGAAGDQNPGGVTPFCCWGGYMGGGASICAEEAMMSMRPTRSERGGGGRAEGDMTCAREARTRAGEEGWVRDQKRDGPARPAAGRASPSPAARSSPRPRARGRGAGR